jgi:hypothetical protein
MIRTIKNRYRQYFKGDSMSEIVMGKNKKVGDSAFVTEILNGEMLSLNSEMSEEGIIVIGKPDVAKNPMTGELEKILHIIVTDRKTYCPECKKENKPSIEITVTETELCIYPCKRCNQFVWFRSK